MKTIELRHNSGNELIDAIINPKISEAEELGISVNFGAQLANELMIDSVDLTTIIGNLLDNAIEANKIEHPSPDHKFFIEFDASITKSDHLLISVKNSAHLQTLYKDGRFLTTKKEDGHGIGLQQIDAVVDKYDGFIMRELNDGVFSTLIRIPLKLNP